MTGDGATAGITGGLTLDGIVDLGDTNDSSRYGVLTFEGAQVLAGTGSIVFGDSPSNQIVTASLEGDSGTLTIGSGITIHGGNGSIGYNNGGAQTPMIVQGSIDADLAGRSIAVYGTTITNTGTLEANGGDLSTGGSALVSTGILAADGTSTLNLGNSSVTINSPGALVVQPSATVNAAGSLLGNTTDVDLNQIQGTVNLDGSGTSTIPQFLEAMSNDLGNVSAGFLDNFAYNTLAVGSNDYVRLDGPVEQQWLLEPGSALRQYPGRTRRLDARPQWPAPLLSRGFDPGDDHRRIGHPAGGWRTGRAQYQQSGRHPGGRRGGRLDVLRPGRRAGLSSPPHRQRRATGAHRARARFRADDAARSRRQRAGRYRQ